jgi:lipopolysaccharide transport system ATP-binding protein
MRLAFAVATEIRPEILLMDEWLSVGDEDFQNKAEARLAGLVEGSNILFLASHSREMIEKICTRVLVLEHGRIVHDGTPKEILPIYFGS